MSLFVESTGESLAISVAPGHVHITCLAVRACSLHPAVEVQGHVLVQVGWVYLSKIKYHTFYSTQCCIGVLYVPEWLFRLRVLFFCFSKKEHLQIVRSS